MALRNHGDENNKFNDVQRSLISATEYVDSSTMTPAQVHTEIEAVLNITRLREREEKKMIKEQADRDAAKKDIVTAVSGDPDCTGVNFLPTEHLLDLMEKYIFTPVYYTERVASRERGYTYIRARFTMLSALLNLKFPDAAFMIMNYHLSKNMVRNDKVFELVGIEMDKVSSMYFLDPNDQERTKERLIVQHTIRAHRDGEFQLFSNNLNTDITEILNNAAGVANVSTSSVSGVGKLLNNTLGTYQKEYEKEVKRLFGDLNAYIHSQGYDVDPKKPKDHTYTTLDQAYRKVLKEQKHLDLLISKITTPTLSLQDVKGKIDNTGYPNIIADDIVTEAADQTALERIIAPKLDEFRQTVLDEMSEDIFGTTLTEAQNLASEAVKESDVHTIDNEILQNVEATERHVEHLTGKKISLKPGAWFKVEGAKNIKGNYHLLQVKEVKDGYVTFQPSGASFALPELVRYLVDPNHGKNSTGNNIKVSFVYDGYGKPIKSRNAFEVAVGLKNDEKKKQVLVPGTVLTSYDTTNDKNQIHAEIISVGPKSVTIRRNSTGYASEMSYEELYVHLQEEKWKIDPVKDDFTRTENLQAYHNGKIRFTSLKAIWGSIKHLVKDVTGKITKSLDIATLVSDLNGEKIGSDLWKERNAALMKKEKEEVESKVKELKEKYKKGGQKRTGLLEFMSTPPDITDFHGRVLAKAWLQVTLSSFGTLYPEGQMFKKYESQRFWLRVFSASLVRKEKDDKGKYKFATPYEEAIANAIKSPNGTPTDARVEYNTLLAMIENGEYTNPSVAGSMGKSYKGELEGFVNEAEGNLTKDKENVIKKATMPEIYKVVSEAIQNQEWKAIYTVFEKLAGKGYKPDIMFHLFLYLIDQIHYTEGGEHRSKMPMSELMRIGKTLPSTFPLPFFAMLSKESNLQFFFKMLYNNSYITQSLGWKSGNWENENVGPFSYKVPTGGGKNLYKFFLARENNYEILKGLAQDSKPDGLKQYDSAAEKDYAEYRGILNGLMDNLHANRLQTSENIDKQVWSYSPLLNLNNAYFSKLYRGGQYGSAYSNGDWASAEAGIFFGKALDEYENAQNSSLAGDDKEALKQQMGKMIWQALWSHFKYELKTSYTGAASKERVTDVNRDAFVSKYGDRLKKLGLDFKSSYKEFSTDEDRAHINNTRYSYINDDPNKPQLVSKN